MRSVFRFVASVLVWVLLLGAAAGVVAAIAVPRLSGATPYAILTGSMRPAYPPGSLVIVRPVAPDQLGVGDVVTYQLRSGEPAVVTHRIAAVTLQADGGLRFVTRGDANDVDDAAPVRPEQLRGRLWYALPWLGYPTVWLGGTGRIVAVGIVVAVLVLYALSQFVRSGRDHRRAGADRRRSSTVEQT